MIISDTFSPFRCIVKVISLHYYRVGQSFERELFGANLMVQTFATESTFSYPLITDEHAAFFKENGYLVIDDALSMAEVEELRRETVAICRGERGPLRNGFTHTADETDDEVIQRYLCIH